MCFSVLTISVCTVLPAALCYGPFSMALLYFVCSHQSKSCRQTVPCLCGAWDSAKTACQATAPQFHYRLMLPLCLVDFVWVYGGVWLEILLCKRHTESSHRSESQRCNILAWHKETRAPFAAGVFCIECNLLFGLSCTWQQRASTS